MAGAAGLLNPLDHERPGSPWWRAMNERLLRDTCEARSRLLGHPGPASSPSVEPSIAFARQPSPRAWYLAHNVTIVRAYLDHRDLAERENRVERFFINLVLIRLLYAHALVAAPRLALAWLAPTARWLGDPRRAMTGIFLSVSRVLPDLYPLDGELDDYIADEHTVGRLLDVGVIVPRLTELYRWSADELRIPDLTDLVRDATPAYAWDPHDRQPWAPPPTRLVRAVRWALPPPPPRRRAAGTSRAASRRPPDRPQRARGLVGGSCGRSQEAEETRQERHEQRDLEGDRPRVGVDADDLLLDGRGLVGEQFVELRVAHDLRVVLERVGDLLLLGRREHGARVGHVW